MSDVKAAAERLRRINDEDPVKVYDIQKPAMFLGKWGYYERRDATQRAIESDCETLADAYLAEHATNDAAIASCIQGAKELGQSLADAVKQIEWLRLVVQGFTSGAVLSSGGGEWAFLGIDRPVELDPDGIPVYSEELAAALRAATGGAK